MTQSKHTKKALLASALSVGVCLAMLIGSTFAWFTDSVTSGKNTIVAGNLDVELEYKTQEAADWQPVTAETSLFDSEALWEPGHTEVVYLKVHNAGSLALKYQLSVTVDSETAGTSVLGNEIKLSDYLMFGQADDQQDAFTDRPAAISAVEDTAEKLGDYSKESTLLANAEEYVALVVYMPETVGNEANYRGDAVPTIDLGVSLFATQTPHEFDSFDDQYDVGAKYVDAYVSSGDELTRALENAKDGDVIALNPGTTIDNPVEIDTGVTILGAQNAVFTNKVQVTAEGVAFEHVTFKVAMEASDNQAPIQTTDKNLTLTDCEVIRSTETAQPYAWLVDVGAGVLTATNTVFIAPYDPESAFSASPSTIRAMGGVALDGCTIATDGYGFFDSWVTKGSIKNTIFTGIDGRPTLGVFNSTQLDGLVMDGCTFIMGENSTVAAGNFTIKNSTFDFSSVPENGAGNGINVYSENGSIVLENNTFKFSKDTQTGINLTSASWATGDHNASYVTISGNVFVGPGSAAIRISEDWTNVESNPYPNNDFSEFQGSHVVNEG